MAIMKPLGGTEILYNNLLKYTDLNWQQNVNLIPSFCNHSNLDPTRKNIVWQHLMTDQLATVGMNDVTFTNAVDQFIYVSNWQFNQFQELYQLDHLNNIVIKNAIDPIDYIQKPTDKLRLIYTSMPFRGLDILLDAFNLINNPDIELVVYSSNVIYGTQYSNSVGNMYDHLFNRCKSMKNVVYKGYAMNKAIRKALQTSHILAYPSTFKETSCLAAIEAGAAGCKIVTTNLGALPETCDKWATYVNYTENRNELVENYAETLKKEIDNYTNTSYNIQSKWFNDSYSWLNRKAEWDTLLNDNQV
jgi:glycosyltransferase involved in cell wall biosynthesis